MSYFNILQLIGVFVFENILINLEGLCLSSESSKSSKSIKSLKSLRSSKSAKSVKSIKPEMPEISLVITQPMFADEDADLNELALEAPKNMKLKSHADADADKKVEG